MVDVVEGEAVRGLFPSCAVRARAGSKTRVEEIKRGQGRLPLMLIISRIVAVFGKRAAKGDYVEEEGYRDVVDVEDKTDTGATVGSG